MVRERYSERFIYKNQNFRDKLFRQILIYLNKKKISGNYLSNLKLIIFLPFIYFAFYNLKIAYIFILISVIIDLFDGPLARLQKKNSDKGKFIDIFGDFTIYLIVLLSLFYLKLFNNDILVYHFFIFPLVVILSTIKKQEFTKTDWLIKPAPEIGGLNAIVYFLLFIYTYFNFNYFNLIILLINVYYTFLTIYYFIFIQFRWHKK